jgi:hypothetical protein
MNELLEQMLKESELLNDETKKSLVEAFNAELEKAVTEAKELAIAEAKVDFAAQYTADKAALVEAIDTKVTAMVNDEIAELKESIEQFRDLEAEYATKLVESREEMGVQLKADMAQLVETIDVFLQERLVEEVAELKESIEEVKKINYAKTLFESIEDTFRTKFFNESEVGTKMKKKDEELCKKDEELKKKEEKLEETESQLNKMIREKEMARVLEPLHGRPREIMEAILKSVTTDKLDESYTTFIGRVLHESATVVENKSEKENVETSVLAESDSTAKAPEAVKIVTGDTTVVEHVTETTAQSNLSESFKKRLKTLGGIN